MEQETDFEAQLQLLTQKIQDLTVQANDDTLMLLSLLRTLEQLHQNIRDDVFQKTLPKNRQELYHLLREIEAQGGWPYIPRKSLRFILKNLDLSTPSDPDNKGAQ
ncbi:MAG: hypothetical protein KFF72_09650 [Arthrospira sp. SH-MAG29]|nr:hypothetical protein [Arthrospira sp. SH-MAG29]MBS0016604.1 hypothetical protein [Arthrospira sp. SH-MAG29]